MYLMINDNRILTYFVIELYFRLKHFKCIVTKILTEIILWKT